jgi:hypothetical protein
MEEEEEEEVNTIVVKAAKYKKLEEALAMWLGWLDARNGTATDDALEESAKEFGQLDEVADFTSSSGWLHCLIQRPGLPQHVKKGNQQR